MSTMTDLRRANERGYSLIEVLIAITLFAVIIIAALTLYDRSNQVFKQSVESSDMQQSTRVAFDKLAADLRMAGFDYDRDGTPFGSLTAAWEANTAYTSGMLVEPTNPNGHTYICITGGTSAADEPDWPTGDKEQVNEDSGTVVWQENGELKYQQPDEQIEYAGRSAVVLRANFNYGSAIGPCDGLDPCEGGREPKLQSTEFPIVTIANNEIVAYALKPAKWASGESADDLVFYADTSIPRNVNPTTDQKEKKITISGVDLCDAGCNSPPYTLYRYTLKDDGTPDATPVAENIREVKYRYFTTTSAADVDELATYPNGDGQYDGANPNALIEARDDRASIRAVELTLVGMNPQPDYSYTNPTDTVAKNYRTLELKSLITPRNAGRRGMKEYSTDAPGKPELKSICAGACNAVFATWIAPATGGDIESYAILYDESPCGAGGTMPTGGYQYSEEVGLNLSGSVGRYITPGKTYSFAVQAISKWGAAPSDCVGPITVLNRTKPAAPKELLATNLAGTGDLAAQPNRIDLYFTPAGMNESGQDTLSCTGGGNLKQEIMPPAEKRYYEIWRGTEADFEPEGEGVKVLEPGTLTQPVVVGDYAKWSDVTASNCTDYYYRIRVVDYCERKDEWNESGDSQQGASEWYPALGEDAILGRAESSAAPQQPVLTLAKDECTGTNCKLTFTWGAVTQNTDGEPISITKYVLRGYTQNGDGTYPVEPDHLPTIAPGALTASVDVKDVDVTKFELVAVDCKESEPSTPVIYPCVFDAGALVADVVDGVYDGSGVLADPYIIEGATLAAKTDSDVKEFRMTVFDATDGTQFAAAKVDGPTGSASFAVPQTPDGRVMLIQITAVDDKNCTKIQNLYVVDTAPPACSLNDSGTDASIITINKTNVVYTLKNGSANALTMKKVVVEFDADTGDEVESVGFNGTTVTTTCALTTVVVAAPASSVVPATSSSYKLQIDFKDNNLQGANPVKKLCIIYQVPDGDILQCQIHPSAATCSEPASTCQ